MNVAFLGLGTMGSPMARRLIAAGHSLTAWNRTPRDLEGAHVASEAAEAIRDAEIVITMLADEHALRSVLERAVVGRSDALFVEMSTVGRAAALEAAALVERSGARFIDAPVSGSRGAAEAGALIILCGGSDNDVEHARPVLSVLGQVEHVGPLGAGAACKLVINALGAQQMVALTSVLGLAERMGLDRARTLDLISAGPFGSPSFKLKRDRLLGAKSDADFTIALWDKDQRLVLEEAARQGYARPSVEVARSLMQRAMKEGLADADMSAIGELFRKR